jgi:hypothetical protein
LLGSPESTDGERGERIFGSEHEGGYYVDLLGLMGEPRASVGEIVREELVRVYGRDLIHRPRPVLPDEARKVASER